MLYLLMFMEPLEGSLAQATLVLKWGIFVETTSAENR